MNKTKLLGAALSGVLALGFSASPANAVVLETEVCTLTLPETVVYNSSEFEYQGIEGAKDSNATFQTTFLTADMLSCTGGVTPDITNEDTFEDGNSTNWNTIGFLASNGATSQPAELNYRSMLVRDAQTNDYDYKSGFVIEGLSTSYNKIISEVPWNAPHIQVYDAVQDVTKYYPLVLGKAFALQNGYATSSSACVVTMPDLTKHWDESLDSNRTLIPLSNFKCPSAIDGHRITFDNVEFSTADGQDWNSLNPWFGCTSKKTNTSTQFAYDEILGLCIYADGDGVLTKATGDIVDQTTGVRYPVVLAAPFKDKYATDVTAKVKKKGSTLTIKIHADRNDWFNNENNVGSHKRQTVIAKDKADRAIVKRGNKVIAVVKLSVFGNGTVKIKDIAGKNNYTVTLVETDWNHAGVASFKK